ncbi:hypothetical protein J6590_039913 [Homalodisca vitripennis]|nr:hypothetical protein J6590_039913 [Homalodisca vitripennis]
MPTVVPASERYYVKYKLPRELQYKSPFTSLERLHLFLPSFTIHRTITSLRMHEKLLTGSPNMRMAHFCRYSTREPHTVITFFCSNTEDKFIILRKSAGWVVYMIQEFGGKQFHSIMGIT